MKKENKTKIITLRVTPSEYSVLDTTAKEKGMKLGAYVLDRLNEEQGITPSLRRETYFHIQMIRDAARPGYEDMKQIREECDALWHCFR